MDVTHHGRKVDFLLRSVCYTVTSTVGLVEVTMWCSTSAVHVRECGKATPEKGGAPYGMGTDSRRERNTKYLSSEDLAAGFVSRLS